ncbi:uncharacterized protein LOC127450725 isoform X2 [Myxocyprinus asiaticus]|uniref:uncharacterized protein LOC127450725 isoform X2 n=1 Tax=Myxocyprinus asiaticus TaxID=70543 RepID=UPI00222278F6|nr:uncharacterized protein LOC127450725 isoform X2 [Myxocyprinus asiaticus]XP_051570996.1 uncharacterized protein LOC127450725 isoform X2 [Myxocyprinus asiaticus]
MCGKAWTLINLLSAILFITNVHHGQCDCMHNGIKVHLYDELMEDHLFEIKVFSPSETNLAEQQLTLLSVMNTLCSSWNKNKKKKEKFKVVESFEIMLNYIIPERNGNSIEYIEKVCADHSCTGGYKTNYVNKTIFGQMYLQSCNESLSALKCPSKERTTSSPPRIKQTITVFEYLSTTPSAKTIHQTINLSTTPSATTIHQTMNHQIENKTQMQEMLSTVNSYNWSLAVSLLLNILLLFCVWYLYRIIKVMKGNVSQENITTEMGPLQIVEVDV